MRIILLGLLTFALSPVRATLLAYDGFEDYAPANGLTGMEGTNGGTGWANNWAFSGSGTVFPSGVRNMDYSNGAVGMDGGSVSLFRPNNGSPLLQRAWTTPVDLTQPGNALYVSFLWETRGDDGETYTGTGGEDNFFQVAVGESSVPTLWGVYARGNEDHIWRVRFNNASTSTGVGIASNTTYLVVMKMDSNSISSWINPSSVSEPAADAVRTGATLGGTTWDAVNNILIRTAVSSANFNMDEIRIGTTYADVVPAAVPEPATWILLSAAVGLLAAIRRIRC